MMTPPHDRPDPPQILTVERAMREARRRVGRSYRRLLLMALWLIVWHGARRHPIQALLAVACLVALGVIDGLGAARDGAAAGFHGPLLILGGVLGGFVSVAAILSLAVTFTLWNAYRRTRGR